ncbi:MAG TPA: sugar nucleotide-binding protein [Thermodesulfobacteriota bacterium]|nr:sugar nucleotide-binding protein [Thermodesulfobacteriota bacterium]
MKRVIVFGGRGFVGSEIVKQLKGFDVHTADRGETKGKNISVDISDKKSIAMAVKPEDIVINLVGLTPTRKPKGVSYEDIHVKGVKNVVDICKKKKCRLIHMSALGANPKGKTEYIRTKGLGEKVVLNSGLNVTVFCPAIIYDKNNELITMMKNFSKFGFFPNIKAKMQPVFRGDIAKLYVLAVQGKIKERKLEVGGPEVLTLFQMAKLIFNSLGKICLPVPLLFVKSGMYAAKTFDLFGIGKDQIANLTMDNVTEVEQSYIKMKKFSEWVKGLR